MKISRDATQAATVHRNRTFKSRALKWSSHPGNFRDVATGDVSLAETGSSVEAGEGPSTASCRIGSDMSYQGRPSIGTRGGVKERIRESRRVEGWQAGRSQKRFLPGT
jgi:hypothetical protein